jgi:quercetin dioxygenase-like cupin family protein
MIVRHHSEINPEKVPEGKGIHIQWLIDEKVGAPHFALRRFVLDTGGYTPYHTHDWEHEVYVLGGRGCIVDEKGIEHPLREGDVAFVEPALKHQFKNSGDTPFIFLCIVPL